MLEPLAGSDFLVEVVAEGNGYLKVNDCAAFQYTVTLSKVWILSILDV
jgi:hypothetical protein